MSPPLERRLVVDELLAWVAREILEGEDEGLDERSPLLEWGVLNSLEIHRLLSFARDRFNAVPEPRALTPESFADIGSIADLVMASHRVEEDR